MTLLKKLVCKSVREDVYCGGDYDRRFDQASACGQGYQYNPRNEPRKKSRQSSQSNQNKRKSKKGRRMQIPDAIPEQTGIQHQHPEFEDLSADDFVVNAVRKSLNKKPKSRGRRGRLCQTADVDSISTASSLTLDLYGTRNPQYYYGDGDESDVVSEEGKPLRIAPASLSLVAGTTPNYKSARAEEDEAEGYLDQCMGMMADLLVGEAAVPKELKQQQQQKRTKKNPFDEYTPEKFQIKSSQADRFSDVHSQNTYTDESSRGSYSTGQSSYEDSTSYSEFG